MKNFFASIQPIRIPVIYANEYHLISNDKIWKATGSKLLMNIYNNTYNVYLKYEKF